MIVFYLDVHRNIMHIPCWVMRITGLVKSRRQNSVSRGQCLLWTTVLTFSVCILPLLTYT